MYCQECVCSDCSDGILFVKLLLLFGVAFRTIRALSTRLPAAAERMFYTLTWPTLCKVMEDSKQYFVRNCVRNDLKWWMSVVRTFLWDRIEHLIELFKFPPNFMPKFTNFCHLFCRCQKKEKKIKINETSEWANMEKNRFCAQYGLSYVTSRAIYRCATAVRISITFINFASASKLNYTLCAHARQWNCNSCQWNWIIPAINSQHF